MRTYQCLVPFDRTETVPNLSLDMVFPVAENIYVYWYWCKNFDTLNDNFESVRTGKFDGKVFWNDWLNWDLWKWLEFDVIVWSPFGIWYVCAESECKKPRLGLIQWTAHRTVTSIDDSQNIDEGLRGGIRGPVDPINKPSETNQSSPRVRETRACSTSRINNEITLIMVSRIEIAVHWCQTGLLCCATLCSKISKIIFWPFIFRFDCACFIVFIWTEVTWRNFLCLKKS